MGNFLTHNSLNKEDYFIIFNKTSGSGKCQARAESLARQLDGATISEVRDIEPDHFLQHRFNIVFGGDGTISSIASSFMDREPNPKLILAGGGSENHLHKVLTQKNAVVRMSDFQAPDSLEGKLFSHYPGEVEGKGIFLINLGIGKIETGWAQRLEIMRTKFPAFICSYLSYFKTLADLYPNDLTFKMALVDSRTGPLKIPNAENVGPRKLLTIEIEGNPAVKVVKAIAAGCFWRLGIEMPEGIFRTELVDDVTLQAEETGNRITIDGEIVPFEGNLNVRRARKPFLVAALVN